MAWDKRGRYSRSVRQGDRVVRIVFPAGSPSRQAAQIDAAQRAQQQQRRQQLRDLEVKVEQLAAPRRRYEELLAKVQRLALLAAGYHQHQSEWRHRHG